MRLDSQQLRGVIAVPLPHHRPRYYWFPSPRGYRSFPHNPPLRLRAKIDTGIRTGRVDKKLFVEEYFSKVLSRVREIFGDLFEEAGDSRRQRLESRGILLDGYWPPNVRKIGANKKHIWKFRSFDSSGRRRNAPNLQFRFYPGWSNTERHIESDLFRETGQRAGQRSLDGKVETVEELISCARVSIVEGDCFS